MLQSCPTLCNTMDCDPPGSSVYGILQARILEWVSILFSRDLHNTGIEPTSRMSPALASRFFTTSTTSFPVFTLKVSDLKQQSCNISLVPAGCLGMALGFVQLGQFCVICLSSFSGQRISKAYPHRDGWGVSRLLGTPMTSQGLSYKWYLSYPFVSQRKLSGQIQSQVDTILLVRGTHDQ